MIAARIKPHWYDRHVPKAEKLFAAYLKESGQAE
jgi:hypothetical protein